MCNQRSLSFRRRARGFTRAGVERVAEYAAAQALRRDGRLISATKSNGIIHTMPFWDEVVADGAAGATGLTPMNRSRRSAPRRRRPCPARVVFTAASWTGSATAERALVPMSGLRPVDPTPSPWFG